MHWTKSCTYTLSVHTGTFCHVINFLSICFTSTSTSTFTTFPHHNILSSLPVLFPVFYFLPSASTYSIRYSIHIFQPREFPVSAHCVRKRSPPHLLVRFISVPHQTPLQLLLILRAAGTTDGQQSVVFLNAFLWFGTGAATAATK